MGHVNADICSCCGDIWHRENLNNIKLGEHELHLCKNCYDEYSKSLNREMRLEDLVKSLGKLNVVTLEDGQDYIQAYDVLETVRRWSGVPHSLKTKLSGLRHKGYITTEEYERLKKALDNEAKKKRKVNFISDGDADGFPVWDMAECPECGREFEVSSETWQCEYCPDCGQELDWEFEEDDNG